MAGRSRRQGNLPAEVTTFIGRRRELADLRAKLGRARLVSLVGAGGVGKTRLAIRAASDLGRGFPSGAWLVELAEVGDPRLVDSAVLAALDLRDQTARDLRALVLSYLRDRQALLVVDNCEHLLEAAARLVHDIIASAPGVRVIATSREPLGTPGEHVLPVPPLELPVPDADEPLPRLAQNEAVMLFLERAVAAAGRFELTPANRTAVIDLCRRLDGLPLAIELAAVRTRVLTAEQISDRLTDRFALLTGGGHAALPRHQTLQTAIDWSYELLADDERVLFRRLSIFAGRFELDDAEAVCTDAEIPQRRTLALLTSLVEKSLVIKEDVRGQACYRLHETMRAYAALRLRGADDEAMTETQCLEHYRLRCQQSSTLAGHRLVEWLRWLDLEIDNVRAVLQRCLVRGDVATGLDMAFSLRTFWATRATNEGMRWLDELLAADGGDSEQRGRAFFIRGFLSVLHTDPVGAGPALERAVATARSTGQANLLSHSLSMASIAENMAGDSASARRLLSEAQAATDGLGDASARLSLLQAQALNGFFEGDLETVGSATSHGVRQARESGDLYALEVMLGELGSAALMAGDLDAANALYTEALRIGYEIDDRVNVFHLLDALGCHAASTDQARLAAQLLGAAEAVRAGVGAAVLPFFTPLVARAEDIATAALGAARFRAEFEAGKRLSRGAAVALALGDADQDRAQTASDADRGPLTRREAEIAHLVAEGLSNKQIGARLFISENTAESHVRSILNKLGFNSRAQIAAWMASASQ